MLHIRLLGAFVVTTADQPLAGLTRAQLKTLLAFLALRRHTPPTREEVIKLFWPVKLDSQDKNNLRTLLHYLKQVLPGPDEYWVWRNERLTWQPTTPWRFDVADFEAACALAAQCTEPAQQQAALVAAIALYTGELWPECREAWIIPERERLHNMYISALEQLLTLLETQRDYASALPFAQKLLQAAPLREENYRRLMHLYAGLADRAGIERTFQECQTQLLSKLKVAPSLPTRELYTRLLHSPAAHPHHAALPLVERRCEWAEFQKRWEGASQGNHHCLLLTGAAGIGKTRLLTEFVAGIERHGQAVVAADCHPFRDTVAYAPLLMWLRSALIQRRILALPVVRRTELACLLPELSPESAVANVMPPLESWQRQRLYETLVQLFCAHNEPLLLVLDNAQWCDQGTIDWLHYLLRVSPTAKILVVAALSTVELRNDSPVARLWPRLQQSQLVTELPLKPLTADGVLTLGSALAGQPLATTMGAQVYAVTVGNPLYVVEAFRLLLISTILLTQSELLDDALLQSPLVQATLQLYFTALSALACDVVGLAATIGYTFSFELLAAAALTSRETLFLVIDELLQRQVVCDFSEGVYSFTHHLLQRAAYVALSSARRSLWHERVTQARQQLGS